MTVDRGLSATGSWEMVARRPGAGLEAAVADYGGYREEGTTPLRRREVPNRGVVRVIGFGGALRISGQLGADEGGRTVTSFVARTTSSRSSPTHATARTNNRRADARRGSISDRLTPWDGYQGTVPLRSTN
jgi:hypothetical protein